MNKFNKLTIAALRKRLLPFGLSVVVSACFTNGTNAAEKTAQEVRARISSERLSRAERKLSAIISNLSNTSNKRDKQSGEASARALLPSVSDPDARLMWEAAILTAMKDYERAGEVLTKVKHFDHGSFTSLKMAAKTDATLLKFDDAIALSTLAMNKYKDEEIYSLRATSYMTKKKFAQAAKDYIEAASFGYASLNYSRAAACSMRNREPDKALLEMDKSFQLAKPADVPDCYFSKGACLLTMKRYKGAVAAFTSAWEKNAEQQKVTKSSNLDYTLFATQCLEQRLKCYDILGMATEAARDRKQLALHAKDVEQEIFGK